MIKKINEIGEVVAGGTPSTLKAEYWNGDIAWLTPRDLSNYNDRYISKGERTITKLGLINSSAKILPKNSILFTSRAPIGYIAIANNEICTNQGFKSIVCNDKICDYMFLYYWLKNNIDLIKSKANGSTFQEISGSSMKDIEIDLPELQIQKKISKTLNNIDSKIELNNKINDNLQKLSQELFKSWFIDFEFPNEESMPYKSSGGVMVESELGLIPEGWKIETIKELANISSGKRPSIREKLKIDQNNFPIIGASGIIGYTNSFLKENQSLLIGRVGTLGVIQRYCEKIWPSDNTLIIESMFINFIEQILKTIDYKSLNRGSTQPLLTQGDLNKIKIILPDNNILNKYENITSNIYFNINNNNLKNSSLNKLRDILLPKLINEDIEI